MAHGAATSVLTAKNDATSFFIAAFLPALRELIQTQSSYTYMVRRP
jgi:hypothetical protein